MTLKSRLEKLANKLKPEEVKIYHVGWSDCTWSESEGLFRQANESKEAFCNRVHQTTKK
jgi:imidazoleglycerol phosphate synthase glutamine amidotransferase subunit HisH